MDRITHWLLANVLSPLLLPVFLIVVLAGIFGCKPEPIASAFIKAIGAICTGVLKLISLIFEGIFGIFLQRHPTRTKPTTNRKYYSRTSTTTRDCSRDS